MSQCIFSAQGEFSCPGGGGKESREGFEESQWAKRFGAGTGGAVGAVDAFGAVEGFFATAAAPVNTGSFGGGKPGTSPPAPVSSTACSSANVHGWCATPRKCNDGVCE
jgi:hypothetical protein